MVQEYQRIRGVFDDLAPKLSQGNDDRVAPIRPGWIDHGKIYSPAFPVAHPASPLTIERAKHCHSNDAQSLRRKKGV